MPLKVVPRKGSPYWYVRGTVEGIEIFESTKCTDKGAAEDFRLHYEVELKLEKSRSESGKKTLSECIDIYLKQGGEDTYIEGIRNSLGHYYPDEIDQALLDKAARETYPHQSNSSVKRWFYDPFVAVTRFSHKRNLCALQLYEKPKTVRKAPKWAEPEWFTAVWPHCSPRLKALSYILLYSGARVSEALDLHWEGINYKEQSAYVPETKTRVPRTIYLRDVVIAELTNIRPQKPQGRIFRWKNRNGVNRAIRRAVERCNKYRAKKGLPPIEYLSSHKIGSHSYATWMRRYAGLDPLGLARTGRWADSKSTEIYTHTIASEEAKKADKLPVPRAKSVQSAKKRQKS